jgi:hypothetical protein
MLHKAVDKIMIGSGEEKEGDIIQDDLVISRNGLCKKHLYVDNREINLIAESKKGWLGSSFRRT